jgi:hypothetical protein
MFQALFMRDSLKEARKEGETPNVV